MVRLSRQLATVSGLIDETPDVRSIELDSPAGRGHCAGQHVDVRLTAEDGYQAQRSYSIASAPEDERLILAVERLDDGEVSPYLVGELRPGDKLEFRGPVGGYFVWEEALGGPLLLVAGGSEVVPLRAILRHHRAVGSTVPVRCYSARTFADVIHRDELAQFTDDDGVEVHFSLTRTQPERWRGYGRRIDPELLEEVSWPASERPLIYICARPRSSRPPRAPSSRLAMSRHASGPSASALRERDGRRGRIDTRRQCHRGPARRRLR